VSDSPMLSKMDALLKKHRGGVDGNGEPTPEQAAPADAWLPVLTQVIERGTPPVVPVAAASPTVTPPVLATPPAESVAPAAEVPPTAVSDTLAEQLMSELAPRLSEVMEKQVAAKLRKNLDQTVASLLSQIDVNVREIVREAVAEKLKQPRDPSA